MIVVVMTPMRISVGVIVVVGAPKRHIAPAQLWTVRHRQGVYHKRQEWWMQHQHQHR